MPSFSGTPFLLAPACVRVPSQWPFRAGVTIRHPPAGVSPWGSLASGGRLPSFSGSLLLGRAGDSRPPGYSSATCVSALSCSALAVAHFFSRIGHAWSKPSATSTLRRLRLRRLPARSLAHLVAPSLPPHGTHCSCTRSHMVAWVFSRGATSVSEPQGATPAGGCRAHSQRLAAAPRFSFSGFAFFACLVAIGRRLRRTCPQLRGDSRGFSV